MQVQEVCDFKSKEAELVFATFLHSSAIQYCEAQTVQAIKTAISSQYVFTSKSW